MRLLDWWRQTAPGGGILRELDAVGVKVRLRLRLAELERKASEAERRFRLPGAQGSWVR